MSVIENAIKRLQASRAAVAATARGKEYGAAATSGGAARRRELAADANAAVPTRTIVINQDALRIAGLLPPTYQERELAQQFRQIKRPLINNALGRGVAPLPHGNLIMVASAVPGEGKTFTSLNLTLSMCLEEDVTALLVDGDVVKPRITRILGLENEPGLLDVVRDPSVSLGSAILATDVPGLSFLPAGRPDANSTELLASARMRDVAALLSGHDTTRLVLFDSAPLLLTTESQALAQVAGQILVVVRADHTPQHVVLDALERFDEGKPVFLVLNQSMQQPHAGYYYQYGRSAGPREDASGA
jgi:exopolysaccharide/PEP-CTERM locus tyrosine autokinase